MQAKSFSISKRDLTLKNHTTAHTLSHEGHFTVVDIQHNDSLQQKKQKQKIAIESGL